MTKPKMVVLDGLFFLKKKAFLANYVKSTLCTNFMQVRMVSCYVRMVYYCFYFYLLNYYILFFSHVVTSDTQNRYFGKKFTFENIIELDK